MHDDNFDRRTWPERLLTWCVWGALIVAAAWFFFNRERFRPRPLTPQQYLAVVRDTTEREAARHIAADHLEHADGSVVPGLIEELKHGDRLGRELAALALGRLGTLADEAADALILAGNDSEVGLRRQATIALGRIGAPPEVTISGLHDRLRDSDASVRDEAFNALERQAQAGARELANLIKNPDADVRRRAAIKIGQMGPDAKEVIADLHMAVADSDPQVRAETYAALAKHEAIDAQELIAAMKNDAEPFVRRTALELLGEMGNESKEVDADLRAGIADSDPHVRAETYAARAKREAIDPQELVAAVENDSDPLVQRTALAILGEMGSASEEAVPAIAALLESTDEVMALRAAIVLGQIGPPARAAADALCEHLDDPREYVRLGVLPALRNIGPEGSLRPPALFQALHDDGDRARSLILRHPLLRPEDGATRAATPLFRVNSAAFQFNSRDRRDSGYGVADSDMPHVAKLVDLEFLDLSYNPVGDAGLALLSDLKQLKRLNLSGTNVTSAGLLHIAGLKNLQWLSLHACAVADEGLMHVSKLCNLKHLDVRSTRVTDAGMVHLAELPQLKALWLQYTRVTDSGLAHLKMLPALEQIQFGPEQFTPQALAQLTNLTALDLMEMPITDSELKSLESLTRLRTLKLAGTKITDSGLTSIARFKSLESLLLDGTQVSDAGLVHLASLTNLRWLAVQQTKVSQRGADELKTSLPDLEVWPFDRPWTPATLYVKQFEHHQ